MVLADGSIADVKIDFDTLARLSKVGREKVRTRRCCSAWRIDSADSAFHNFPRTETAEIHLATNFQTMLYDNISHELRNEVYDWLRENAKDERKPSDTDEQFFYKTRKKALGPFKRRFWDLPADVKARLGKAYEEKFTFLFTQLGVAKPKRGPIVTSSRWSTTSRSPIPTWRW